MHMADALLSPAVGAMWAAAAPRGWSLAPRTRARRRPPGAADGHARRVRVRGADDQLQHPGHGLQRAPGRRPAAGDPARPARGLHRHRLGADGAGAVLRRWRPAGAGRQHVQPGRVARFLAYPLSTARWRPRGPPRAAPAAVLAAVLSLQLGALAVVLETVASGISALPFGTFVALMLPIHLAIGMVEGLVTAAVVAFVRTGPARCHARSAAHGAPRPGCWRHFVAGALLTGGVAPWFASTDRTAWSGRLPESPAPCEPAMAKTSVHALARVAAAAGFPAGLCLSSRRGGGRCAGVPASEAAPVSSAGEERLGTTLAGLVGGAMTLMLAALIGFGLSGWPAGHDCLSGGSCRCAGAVAAHARANVDRRIEAGSHMSANAALTGLLDFRRLDALAAGDSVLHCLDPRAKLLATLVFIVVVMSFEPHAWRRCWRLPCFPTRSPPWRPAGRIPAAQACLRAAVGVVIGLPNPLFDRQVCCIGAASRSAAAGSRCCPSCCAPCWRPRRRWCWWRRPALRPLCNALGRVGMPQALVVQLLFLYRYLTVLAEEALRMSTAHDQRSGGHRLSIRQYAALVGSLLLRTWSRAERIHLAMCARGFDGILPSGRASRFGTPEWAWSAGSCLLFVLLRTQDPAQGLGMAVLGWVR